MPESRAEFLSSREAPLERAYLRSIREGIVPPTAVQSMSRAEAAFYGLVSHTESDDAIVRGFASVNPFVMGWNGLSGERDATGRSLDLRSSQRLDLLSLEHPVLLGGLSFAQGGLFATTEIGFTTMGLVKSAEPSGLFGIWSARDYLRWWTFPDQAYVSWAGKHTSLAAGRFKTGIGFGDANLFLNGKANWYDHIEWAWWSSRFRFYSLWGTSSSQLSSEEYACQSANWDTENTTTRPPRASRPLSSSRIIIWSIGPSPHSASALGRCRLPVARCRNSRTSYPSHIGTTPIRRGRATSCSSPTHGPFPFHPFSCGVNT
jgi:hypothetical protein